MQLLSALELAVAGQRKSCVKLGSRSSCSKLAATSCRPETMANTPQTGSSRFVVSRIELEWLDPLEGATDLGPTLPQELPDDADELTRSKQAGHPLVVQAWWQALREG